MTMRVFVAGCLLLAVCSSSLASEITLEWSDLPPLPDKFGFGGPIVGVHNDALIVAGGANFPDGPPWPDGDRAPGAKVWHDRIFVLEPGSQNWIVAGRLPRPLAYAPAISTGEGVFVIGGETYDIKNHATDGIVLLSWDPNTKRVTVVDNALPNLPKPCQYHNAALINRTIYVTASHARNDSSQRLDEKAFWSLDLDDVSPANRVRGDAVKVPECTLGRTGSAGSLGGVTDRVARREIREWSELPAWPGAAREKMAVAVQRVSQSGQPDSECLYMISGSNWFRDKQGNADLQQFEYFTDGYRYDPARSEWQRIADLPRLPELRKIETTGFEYDVESRSWRIDRNGESQRARDVTSLFRNQPRPTAAATAIGVGKQDVMLFSGATGRFITLDIRQRPMFPREVIAYDSAADTWRILGRMPTGVVTTGIASWKGRIVIPSGEIRPGVRTNRVQSLIVREVDGVR